MRFVQAYFAELEERGGAGSREGPARSPAPRPVTLLYAAKDERHNNAVALEDVAGAGS